MQLKDYPTDILNSIQRDNGTGSEASGLIDYDEIETLKWKLSELANSEPENIESNDLEIMGEDSAGRDGYCTVQINKIAEDALKVIEQLQAT